LESRPPALHVLSLTIGDDGSELLSGDDSACDTHIRAWQCCTLTYRGVWIGRCADTTSRCYDIQQANHGTPLVAPYHHGPRGDDTVLVLREVWRWSSVRAAVKHVELSQYADQWQRHKPSCDVKSQVSTISSAGVSIIAVFGRRP